MPGGPPAQIAEEYLTASYTGDFGRARDLVAETFAFRGPFLHRTCKRFRSFLQGLRPFYR